MGAVVVFPRHRLHSCRGKLEECQICAGGLGVCEVCGGGEAWMPTDCPGKKVQYEVLEQVGAGKMDYTRQDGWMFRRDVRDVWVRLKDFPPFWRNPEPAPFVSRSPGVE